jgi:hypothetical protein
MKKALLFLTLVMGFYGHAQIITTIAGTGVDGYSGDNGLATNAQLNGPNTIAFDQFGNMYITDNGNSRIRKVANGTGIITTVAGTGNVGSNGDNGPATAADINPLSIVIDTFRDNIYFSEPGHIIRKINATGIISTIAGTGVPGYNGDNILAINAQLFYPYLGAVDALGNLYFSDYSNHRVRKITPSGIITTVAGTGSSGTGGNNGPATAAQLGSPVFMIMNTSGDLYIPDNVHPSVRLVNTAGIMSTVAGTGTSSGSLSDGIPATDAALILPNNLTLDDSGNMYIACTGVNMVRKVNSAGIISTIAGTGATGYGGDGGAAIFATFNRLNFVTYHWGNLYIADTRNNRIRRITYSTAGVDEMNNMRGVTIYPNPAKDEVTISAGEIIKDVLVKDVVGRMVMNKAGAGHELQLDISDLSPGIFFVEINGAFVGRFIKK